MMTTTDADVLSRLEDSTREARRIQLEVLDAILDRNCGAGYLRPYLLAGSPSSAEAKADAFRRLVPLSSYEDYADLIRSIADGDEPPTALSVDPLLCFFFSSGTSTMKPKLIAYFDSANAKSSSHLAHAASSVLLRRSFPPRPSVNKILWFLYAGNVTETKGGFRAMPSTAFPFQNKSSATLPAAFSACISPPEVILGSDMYQQLYCHLICGLRNPSIIDAIRAPHAAGLVRAIRLLESKWEQLCEDIEQGSVSSEILDPSIREAIAGEPQPEIAMAVREACKKENWAGILCELWPEMRYIACVTTGSMEQYYKILKYYAGETMPILGGDYFASECPVGINMDRLSPPELTSYVILPAAAYFEFLPFKIGSAPISEEANVTVDIAGVEIGKLYEVVVTAYRGLYRYRLGDVVRVVGFHNASPRVEFTTRAPKEGSEAAFTERDLMLGMEGLELMIRDEGMGEVVEFAGFFDTEAPHKKNLVVFAELSKEWKHQKLDEFKPVLRKGCQIVEGSLGSVYKMKRESGDVGPMELLVVKPGSFEGLAMVAFESGAPANQYKPPKILRNIKLVDLLRQSVLISVSLN